AVRMHGVASVMAAHVAVEGRSDVVQLVEQGHEFPFEILVQKPRQAEGHDIEHLGSADEVALHLIGDGAAAAKEPAMGKTKRSEAGLQAMTVVGPCPGHAD